MMTSIRDLNAWPLDRFVAEIGPVFEHSPWIAEETWPFRPFASRAGLHAALCRIMRLAPLSRQLELIQAHPDLAGRLAQQGQLTAESTREQASAGLDALDVDELARLTASNDAYRAKFSFPFIICARLNNKEAILRAFAQRLPLSRDEEIATALAEIEKIADLRLANIVQD